MHAFLFFYFFTFFVAVEQNDRRRHLRAPLCIIVALEDQNVCIVVSWEAEEGNRRPKFTCQLQQQQQPIQDSRRVVVVSSAPLLKASLLFLFPVHSH